jgi:hypothetical protein
MARPPNSWSKVGKGVDWCWRGEAIDFVLSAVFFRVDSVRQLVVWYCCDVVSLGMVPSRIYSITSMEPYCRLSSWCKYTVRADDGRGMIFVVLLLHLFCFVCWWKERSVLAINHIINVPHQIRVVLVSIGCFSCSGLCDMASFSWLEIHIVAPCCASSVYVWSTARDCPKMAGCVTGAQRIEK